MNNKPKQRIVTGTCHAGVRLSTASHQASGSNMAVELLAALVLTIGAFGQSPKAIIAKMESVLEKHEKEGIVMTVDVKVPIVGTMTTKSWILGDKMRMEATLAGVKVITWTDGKTELTYNTKTNFQQKRLSYRHDRR